MTARGRTRSDVELPQSLRLVRHLPARATACSQSYGPPQASNNPQRPPPVAATRRSTHVRLTAPQESPRTSTHRRHWEQTPQGPSPAPALDLPPSLIARKTRRPRLGLQQIMTAAHTLQALRLEQHYCDLRIRQRRKPA